MPAADLHCGYLQSPQSLFWPPSDLLTTLTMAPITLREPQISGDQTQGFSAQHLKHIYPTNQGHSLQNTSHSSQCCVFIHTHHPTSIPLCTLDKFLLISPELAFSEKLPMTTKWAHSSPGWPLGESLMHGLNYPNDLCPRHGLVQQRRQ